MRHELRTYIIMLLTFTLLSTGLTYVNIKKGILPKPVAPTFSIINHKTTIYPFDKTIDMADMIVYVKISDISSNLTPPDKSTIFKANVIKTYKGVTLLPHNNSINIIQHGSINYSYNGYPLFEKNEEMILFLKKASGMDRSHRP